MKRVVFSKKGVSEIVAYVLLVAVAIALSILVYNWLRFYVSGGEVPECKDGVNLIIKDFTCYGGDNLTVVLENKGRFSVDGFILRVHNRTDADFGFYILNDTEFEIAPGSDLTTVANLSDFENLTYLEVQPFVIEEEKSSERISCKSATSQDISCV